MRYWINIEPYIRAMRPGQWTKNVFCLAGPFLAAGSLTAADWVTVILVFMGFCALSSAIYFINDLCNLEEDRAHPVKQFRPLAKGEVAVAHGVILGLLLAIVGIVLLSIADIFVLKMGVAYLAIHSAYSLGVRDVPVLELLFLATGFALRVLAGAGAVGVDTGGALLGATYGVSLLLGLGKRKAEVQWGTDISAQTRPVLRFYTPRAIRLMLIFSTVFTIATYYGLAVQHFPRGAAFVSTAFVIAGVGRFLWIILFLSGGERPERLLYGDVVLTTVLILWGGVAVFSFYGL